MRASAFLLSATLLLGSASALADGDNRSAARQRVVDREMAGKVAGEAQDCISTRSYQRIIVASDRTLLFRVSGNLFYRNDLAESCPGMADSPYRPAIRSFGSRHCRGDIATVERGPGASCALGPFVPYRGPAR